MTCDIFIRSYRKDLGWLELCLAAVAKFCRGFRAVVVVVPRASERWLRRLPPLAPNVRVEICPDYADDYLGQQLTKLQADHFTDADFVCHVDSDCIFTQPVSPDDLLDAGRPRIVMRSYASLDRHWPWQAPTEAFLGWKVTHDFMQRPPFVFPRWIYAEFRAHARSQHGMDLEQYILSRPPRAFSEFNALGAFAHARHTQSFSWELVGDERTADSTCRWYWSWGGLDDGTRTEIEALLQSDV